MVAFGRFALRLPSINVAAWRGVLRFGKDNRHTAGKLSGN